MGNVQTSDSLVAAWNGRKDCKGYDKTKGSSFNSWRSIRYTTKGKDAGSPATWKDYNVFMEDVQGTWERGMVVVRTDTKAPHSSTNSTWMPKGSESMGKLIQFKYNGQTQTLLEWCVAYNLNYNGVRQRYFKGVKYTAEEVLFGKKKRVRPKLERDEEHRTSSKLGAYRLSDKKKGLACTVTLTYFREVIKKGCEYCGYIGSIGLDRVDNAVGHTPDNVVPCCYECNTARNNNFTYDEMLLIGNTIKYIREARNADN